MDEETLRWMKNNQNQQRPLAKGAKGKGSKAIGKFGKVDELRMNTRKAKKSAVAIKQVQPTGLSAALSNAKLTTQNEKKDQQMHQD